MSLFSSIVERNFNINFIKYNKFLLFAGLFYIFFAGFLSYKKGINFGIDFVGGVDYEITGKNVSSQQLKNVFTKNEDFNIKNAIIKKTDSGFIVSIKISQDKNIVDLSNIIKDLLNKEFASENIEYLRSDYVGPNIGLELIFSSLKAIFLALIGIFIYLMFRFNWKYAFGGIFALLYDIAASLSIFTIIDIEFTSATVAAILTILGYSINNSVVIYSSIREMLGQGYSIDNAVNYGVNNTLSRTILSSITTLLVIIMLMVYSDNSTKSFTWTILAGVISGTYSSIIIAPHFIFLLGSKKKKAIKNKIAA